MELSTRGTNLKTWNMTKWMVVAGLVKMIIKVGELVCRVLIISYG